MALLLKKPVVREMFSGAKLLRGKDSGRSIIVSLEPGDSLSFRLKGTRKNYSIYLGHCFRLAQLMQNEADYKAAMTNYTNRKKAGAKGLRKPKRTQLPYGDIYFKAIK